MEVKPVEVYCEDSNYAVMKPPGRRFPGAVIQGDSLAILARNALRAVTRLRELQVDDDDLRGELVELTNELVGRVLHYQMVLEQHGIEFPHVHPLTQSDIISE